MPVVRFGGHIFCKRGAIFYEKEYVCARLEGPREIKPSNQHLEEIMIILQPVTEKNYLQALHLQLGTDQKEFVASPAAILARAYAYRRNRAKVWGVYAQDQIVGLMLLQDLNEEPACYHLSEFMIDQMHQGRGYGQKALALLLRHCCREHRFENVEVCVNKNASAARHVYEKLGFTDTRFVDPGTPDCLCLSCPLPAGITTKLDIHRTGKEDLLHVQRLWADPDVMHFVGFPEGLHRSMESLEKDWLPWVQKDKVRCHWSIYAEGIGYCGETFCNVDETGLAVMDIKLISQARGKGIGYQALSYALDQAFRECNAQRAYADPHPENKKALALYASLGFLPAKRPSHLDDPGCPCVYLEINKENWEARYED